jgi:hypothetical protein
MQVRNRLSLAPSTRVAILAVAVCLPAALVAGPGLAADSSKVVVKPPTGAAKPVAATGMGTPAAMDDPRCNVGDAYGVYGRWDTSTVGSGPGCVRPFEDGEKNGGATAKGVTGDSVKVVAVIPSIERSTQQSQAAPPVHRNDNSASSWENAVHDYLYAYHNFYEQWGRAIDVTFYTSTGVDEVAQRADAVAIQAMKPFAVTNFDTYGLDTLVTLLAQAKILVNSYSTSTAESAAVAPYRWGGGSDVDAAAANAAEVIGKQLVGKKAEYGGDDVKGETRKFGMVMVEDLIDVDAFKETLTQYGGKSAVIASEASYPGTGGAAGDVAVSEQNAPVFVSKLKSEGVTTVVLFADRAMNMALMQQANEQDWFPEWFYTGSGYDDLPVLAQALPDEQAQHGFGISIIGPFFEFPPEMAAFSGVPGAYNWYWGTGVGTTSGVVPAGLNWILAGMHYAGPELTVGNFKQGLFSAPPLGGDPKNPLATLTGYGRTTGLPYDAYTPGPADFAGFFMDPLTTAISPGTGSSVKHASFYPDDARRYHSGQWPKTFPWFDKSVSITQRMTYPPAAPPLKAAPPCAAGQCPSTGAATPEPGASGDNFVVEPTPGAISTA